MLSFAVALFMLASGESRQPAIQNPGFEASPPLAGWEVKTRVRQEGGRAPTLAVDQHDAKEGRQSLRVEAQDPAFASASQRISLPVGSLWRARVWIKTQNLSSASDQGAQGIIGIETPAGEIAASVGRAGTTPWQEEEVTFRVPSPGYVDLTLLGMRRGIGKVWFDDVRMEAVPSEAHEDIRIFSKHATERPIDTKQQGQFIELLCNLVPSIIAQQVVSTSFEDAPPCHVAYRRQVDEPYRPWYLDGAVQVAQYSFDTVNPFRGARSQKIVVPVAHARAGISQDGFYLKPGVSYMRIRMGPRHRALG
jgi:hypothetical protein